MTYISKCEHGTPMALCRKCFPDVSEHNDWSKYKYTHPLKEQDTDCQYCKQGCIRCDARKQLTDEEIIEIGLLTTDPRFSHIESPLLLEFARAILRKAQEK